MKTLFEQAGGTYTMQGDYCLPDLELPPEKEQYIGVWGTMPPALSKAALPNSVL